MTRRGKIVLRSRNAMSCQAMPWVNQRAVLKSGENLLGCFRRLI
jgi:hypothetical protein